MISEQRTKEISLDRFVSGVSKKCSQILNTYKSKPVFIYRGIDYESSRGMSYGFVQPSKFSRESANVPYNYYTLLIDNLSAWKAFPKRSNSIICTTDMASAKTYGELYIVFPKDGSKIGVAPRGDIWLSFDGINDALFRGAGLDDLNFMIANLARGAGFQPKELNSWPALKAFLKEGAPYEMNPKARYEPDDYEGFDFDKPLLPQIEKLMDPKKNGFKLISTRGPIPSGRRGNEMWTDGDTYFYRAPNNPQKDKDVLDLFL